MLGCKGLNFNPNYQHCIQSYISPIRHFFCHTPPPPPHHANNLHQCGFLFLLLSKLLSPKTVKNKVLKKMGGGGRVMGGEGRGGERMYIAGN